MLACAVVASLALGLRRLPGMAAFSPMILAMVLGVTAHNLLPLPQAMRPGVMFSQKRLLRLAIVLLGLQLTAAQVIGVGGAGLAILVAATLATFAVTVWLGRLLGVDRKLSELIAAGVSICGASAIVATNTVTRAEDEDVAYALACVTLFGTLAIFLYPLLRVALGLDEHGYGLWTGASIHEVAQVVAAAFQGGQEAGAFATIVKLTRVMLLAPLVLVLGLFAARSAKAAGDAPHARPPVPWFVFGFIAAMLLNSVWSVPTIARGPLTWITTFLFTMALAAMGLETSLSKLRAKGLRPLLLGAAATLFIAGLSLGLIELFA